MDTGGRDHHGRDTSNGEEASQHGPVAEPSHRPTGGGR
jgi:hypothetical protein